MYLTDTCILKITGGITITGIEHSEIKQRVQETIKEGLDDEYLDIVKELEGSFYAEDIAAAAIMLYAEQGGRREVRRRTLNKAPFIPLRTKEAVARGPRKLPAVHARPQAPAMPAPARRSPPAASAAGNAKGHGNKQNRPRDQKGRGNRGMPPGRQGKAPRG